MIYDDILAYFGQQNFAAMATNGDANGLQIVYNRVGDRPIFCVLIDATKGRTWIPTQIQNVNQQITTQVQTDDVLFLVVTDNVTRDKALAQVPGVKLWLVDAAERHLLIYENQPDDFFGLHYGILQSITQTRGAKVQAMRKWKNWPWVTIILIAINVIWFFVLIATGDPSDASFMVSSGASYGPLIFEGHQYWRILTSMFMHFSLSHLAGNMIYLGLAGNSIERTFGHIRFLLLYMLAGIGSGIASAAYYYLTGENIVSAGASGAIYGIIGAVIYLMIKNRGRMPATTLWWRIGILLIFLFYSNFINKGIDVVAHVSGLVFGFLLAMSLIRREKT